MKTFIRSLCLIYLLSVAFFSWGWLAVKLQWFPYPQIEPFYTEIYNFFDQSHKESLTDMVKYDHQEQKTAFDFSGLAVQDNSFKDDGYMLLAAYSKQHRQAIVSLLSLESGKTLHQWLPNIKDILRRSPEFATGANTLLAYRSQHPQLLANGDLLISSGEGPLARINPCGDVVWLLNRHFHHSIEALANGDFIVPLVINDGLNDQGIAMREDGFAIVSEHGKLIKEYSVYTLLMNNGYAGLIYGVGAFEHDRFHLNDVQPIAGQPTKVLLSIRNLSSIAQFDLDTGKVDWLKTGPWANQHDVNALADGWVSVFGNNLVRGAETLLLNNDGLRLSQIYLYHPATGQIKTPFSHILHQERVHTAYEGRVRLLDNGDAFIEETNRGRLLRLSPQQSRWQYVHSVSENSTGALHWSGYLEKRKISPQLLENLQCHTR